MHRRVRGPTGRPAQTPAAVVDEPVPRVQHAAAAPLGEPALAGDVRLVRLAVDRAVELERRVAAEDEPVDAVRLEPRGREHRRVEPRFGLQPREQLHHLGGRQRAIGMLRRRRGDGRLLIHPGRERDRLDADRPQRREAGGRRRGEVEAHGLIVCRSPRSQLRLNGHR